MFTRCMRRVARDVAALAAALMLAPASALATTYDVVLDTTGLASLSGVLAFDFIDGGPPSNTVVLSTLTSNGTQGATSTFGDVTGSGPWTFSDAGNTSLFNELLVDFTFGTTLSFSFTTSDDPPQGGSSDAFSFFILDANFFPLVTTDDPTGANALFLVSIGQGAQSLAVYAPQDGVSIAVRPVATPEPFTSALLAIGIAAMYARRERR